ncbi:MAG: hypothetical protein WKG03_20830 [Telluria sp.]
MPELPLDARLPVASQTAPKFAPFIQALSPANKGFIVLFLVITAYFCLAGTRVPVAEGLGWDGKIYGKCAIDIRACLESRQLSAYSLGRLFPSAVIHFLFVLTGTKADPAIVVMSFSVWNLVCIWSSLCLWLDCCRRFMFRPATILFGVSALFFNFAYTRQAFYAPVSTDYTAFAIAMLALWLYAARRAAWSLALILPGGFTWPAATPVLALIGVLKQRHNNSLAAPNKITYKTPQLVSLVALMLYGIAATYFLFVDPRPQASGAAQIVFDTLPASILIALGYVYWVVSRSEVVKALVNIRLHWVPAVVACIMIAVYITAKIEVSSFAGATNAMDTRQLLRALTVSGLVYPALFIIGHVVFLGPWIVIIVCTLPLVLRTARHHIQPFYPVIMLFFILFLLPESRGLTFFLPFVVLALCLTIDRTITEYTANAYCLLALITSHFWLPMPKENFGLLLDFPAQTFFMHIGPWMGPSAYAIGFLELLAACVVAAPLLKNIYASANTGR